MKPPLIHPVQTAPAVVTGMEALPQIARDAVHVAVTGATLPQPPVPTGVLAEPRPVFVTIRDRRGALRGCIGTLRARHDTVVEETRHMAREAALADNRFPAVTPDELPGLEFEVSVLHPLVEVVDPTELDAAEFGVVVSTPDGRRGALLPAVEGIHTVAEQLSVARRKAGIGPREPVRLQRFRVEKVRENPTALPQA